MKISLPTLIGVALFTAPIFANAADFKPANFNFSPSSLESALSTYELPLSPPIAVYCQSNIGNQGDVLKTSCFEKSGLHQLETAIENAMTILSFAPATVDGKAVAVRMNYRVIYQYDGKSLSTLLIPNIGTLQKDLGVDYSEPQERIIEGQTIASDTKNTFFEHNARHIRASASISTTGDSKEIAVVSKGTPKEDVAMVEALKNTQFIPGFVNNTAVEMTYLAIIAKDS